MKFIYSYELSDALQERIDELRNETLPQGQTFFLNGNEIVAIDNSVLPLFKVQQAKGIESEQICQIICEG
jgi:hypothetical protein